jgi:hypothetical protein
MSQSLRPDDLVIGALGQNFLGKVKALVAGANAVSKGDSVVVTSLSFGPRGTPRAGQVTRATAAPDGLVMIASNDAAVGRQVRFSSTLRQLLRATRSTSPPTAPPRLLWVP